MRAPRIQTGQVLVAHWRKKRKGLLIAAGVLYAVFGVLAFFDVPGGHDEHHHSFAHNLTHIVLGSVLLVTAARSSPKIRRAICFCFAAGYAAIGAAGRALGERATIQVLPGAIEFHAGDYWVHWATGLFFLALGTLRRSDEARVHAPD